MGTIPHSAMKRPSQLLLSAVLLASVATPILLPQETVIRVDVRLVRILTTVKNSAGQPVGSLTKGDFQILDNGVPQELAVFEHHTEQPLSVAVLVDTSASTGIEFRYELDSVNKFLRAIVKEGNPRDSVALYTFNFDVTLEKSFTRNVAALENSLKNVRFVGGTSLYDAIFFASADLDDREGRRVIVVITDGGDTTSGKTFHQALEAAQRSDVVLYPIVVVPIKNDPGRNTGGENALTTLAASTGGRIFMPSLGASLDAAFAEILRDLRTQYMLAYYPRNLPATTERFHKIEVKVKQPDLRVSARSGYYEDSEKGQGWTPAR